ncbi:Cysteine_synthase A [Hexamita inflata]|uniref:Cysteine synthase n=1 Tax=Hexamita inflata TaxID=28002 RepID=A0AA86TEC7_9EUKA|nr:Cysteine synthase A [Hexamita inflata]CAI9915917.1 Cysteine synthase A [Hexamita inflata]CAI9934009.1 Cysteine synthase A [Hexamita inflata]
MALIYEVIGETPLVRLQRIPKAGRVLLKLESKNPGGSIKDRPGFQMLKDLLDEGKIDTETVLIEPTSGNTGIGLSMAAAALGLKMTIVMPENMSEERKKLMKAYGSELVLTEAALGVAGSVTKAEELQKSLPKAHIVGQFYNQSNPKAHMLTTAPEIVKQVKQYNLDPKYFITGLGSAGTLVGMSRIFKKELPEMKIVGFEPEQSKVYAGFPRGPHKIQGIAPGFIPQVFEKELCDELVACDQDEAYAMCRRLAKEEGILVGISSAAAVVVALRYAEKLNCDVIAIAADSGERYLSVPGLFQ